MLALPAPTPWTAYAEACREALAVQTAFDALRPGDARYLPTLAALSAYRAKADAAFDLAWRTT